MAAGYGKRWIGGENRQETRDFPISWGFPVNFPTWELTRSSPLETLDDFEQNSGDLQQRGSKMIPRDGFLEVRTW